MNKTMLFSFHASSGKVGGRNCKLLMADNAEWQHVGLVFRLPIDNRMSTTDVKIWLCIELCMSIILTAIAFFIQSALQSNYKIIIQGIKTLPYAQYNFYNFSKKHKLTCRASMGP